MLNRNTPIEDAEQMEQIRQWREKHPIEFADEEPYQLRDLFVVTIILLIVGYIAFQPEVAGFVMAIRGML